MCYFWYLSVNGQTDRQTNERRRSQYLKLFPNIKLVNSATAIKGLIEAFILLTRNVFKNVINAVYTELKF